jgi:hypothetical protein
MYTQIIYFAMEIQTQFSSMSVSGPVIFTIGFILNDLIRTVLPPWVIWQEVKVAVTTRQQLQRSSSSLKDHPSSPFPSAKKNSLFPQSPTDEIKPSASTSGDLNWARYMSLRNRRL